MDNIALLTVIYNKSEQQVNYTRECFRNLPKDIYKLGVINNTMDDTLIDLLDNFMINDENCLAKGWNIGLKRLFEKYNYVVVIGNDQEVTEEHIEKLYQFAKDNPMAGLWAACPEGYSTTGIGEIRHGDGAFSFFMIHRDLYEDVGEFDENFKPAYFEDNDYLERIWLRNYKPLINRDLTYYHIVQGSIKYSIKDQLEYPKYMQKNLEYYRMKWGKTPDHLPEDIKFG